MARVVGRTETEAEATPLVIRRVSWGAVLAGVVVAFAIGLLLNVLGLAIGLSTVDPAQEAGNAAEGLAIGALIWAIVASLIALFAGGWVAGHLAGVPARLDGALNGLVTWGLVTLLTLWFVTMGVGAIINTTFSALGNAIGAVGSALPTAAGIVADRPTTNAEVRDLLNAATPQVMTEPDAEEEIVRAATDFISAIGTANEAAALAELRTTITNNTTLSEAEIDSAISDIRACCVPARESVVQTAEQTADVVAQTALATFAALLAGAVAAVVGGLLGTPAALLAVSVERTTVT